MKKRRLALLALVLTMVLITAFPMTAYAAETLNLIQSWNANGSKTTEVEELSRTHYPMAVNPLYIGTVQIRYTTSGNPITSVEVDGVRVTPRIIQSRYYQVVPGVYRYEHTFQIDVDGVVRPGTERSLIEFATGNSYYGINVKWQAG